MSCPSQCCSDVISSRTGAGRRAADPLRFRDAAATRALLDYCEDLVSERRDLVNRAHADLDSVFHSHQQQIPNLTYTGRLDNETWP